MRDDVARAALRAAARLALTTTVLGCGGRVTVDTPTKGHTASNEPALGGSGGSGGLSTETEQPPCGEAGDPAAPGAEAVACCSELAHVAFPEPGVFPDPVTVDADVKDCCGVLAAHYDALLANGAGGSAADPWTWQGDGDVQWACCASIDYASTTCTPWGPPVPPPMRRRDARRGDGSEVA